MRPYKKWRSSPDVPVTRHFVKRMTGIEDERMIRIILATGANRLEIREACDHYFEDYYTKPTSSRPMSERARRVYDILEYNRAEPA